MVDAVVAFVGLGVGLRAVAEPIERPALEPVVLQKSYYIDDIYDAVIGRPGRAFARSAPRSSTTKVIDGAVNGVARLARRRGGEACAGSRPDSCGSTRWASSLGTVALLGLHVCEGRVVTHDTAFPFLTVLVLLPAGAALAVALVPASLGERRSASPWTPSGMAASLATLALAITIAVRYHAGNGSYRLVSQHVGPSRSGISWHLGVDGISVFLVLMSALLFPLALRGRARRRRGPGPSWPGCCCSRRGAWGASSRSTSSCSSCSSS